MALRPRAALSWSGGKDSCTALQRVRSSLDVVATVTMFDESAERSRSHGLRPEIIRAQCDRLGMEPVIGSCTWQTYDQAFSDALAMLPSRGISQVVFGDIMFEEHRQWAVDICRPHGLVAVEPLWGCSTTDLFHEWIASGADALIVTTRAALLDEGWLGRRLSIEMLPEFVRLGVDPCGERGEYHTVVTNTSLFSAPINLRRLQSVQRSDCWALDLGLSDAAGD